MKFTVLPEITNISHRMFGHVWAVKAHQDEEHELLHIIKGRIVLTLDGGQKYPAEDGETLLTPAGTLHKDVFDPDNELVVFHVHFKWSHYKEYFDMVSNDGIKNISKSSRVELRKIFDAMRLDLGVGEIDRIIANTRLMSALMLIYREARRASLGKKAPEYNRRRRQNLVIEARKYLEKHFREPICLEEVANHLGISQFYLSRIFSKESDFSLVEYLAEIRLNEAKKVLKKSCFSIAEVAQMVGYDDGNYFSKVFKRRFGVAPSQYY